MHISQACNFMRQFWYQLSFETFLHYKIFKGTIWFAIWKMHETRNNNRSSCIRNDMFTFPDTKMSGFVSVKLLEFPALSKMVC